MAKARLKTKRLKAKIRQKEIDGVPSKNQPEYVLGSGSVSEQSDQESQESDSQSDDSQYENNE